MRVFPFVATLVQLLACHSVPIEARSPAEEAAELRPLVDGSGFAGTVLVYRQRDERLVTVHGENADQRLLPASTFKIVNALAALEAGVVVDEHSVIPWDGVVRPNQPEWNQDLDLRTALRRSAVPHFQALARAIGPERMQATVERLGYGNRDLRGGIDRFWLDGELRVSPREQLELVRKLQAGALPVSGRSQEVVRTLLLADEGDGFRIYAKTGWAIRVARQVGWWVGWTERGDDVCFFATALQAERPDPDAFGPARLEVTKRVLERLGCLPEAGASSIVR